MMPPRRLRRLARVGAGWVLSPLTDPFRRAFRLAGSTARILRASSAPAAGDDPADDTVVYLDRPETIIRQQRQTRRRVLFCTALVVADLAWWIGLLYRGAGIISFASIETLWIGVLIALQCLRQGYLNWRLRGRSGDFAVFLTDGRNMWPKSSDRKQPGSPSAS